MGAGGAAQSGRACQVDGITVCMGKGSDGDDSDETIEMGIWRHYKGGLYRVTGLARHHENGKPMVIYVSLKYGTVNVRPMYGWVGDRDAFMGAVKLKGKWLKGADAGFTPRFVYVGQAVPGSVPT